MTATKRVIVTGATGLIGKSLCREMMRRGYEVVVFSRDVALAKTTIPQAADYVTWQPTDQGAWAYALDGAYAVIHLAGASIAGQRWSESYKRMIRDSRVLGTRGLVSALGRVSTRPKVFVSGSAVGYYGACGDTPLDEAAASGSDFLAGVCQAWEAEALKAEVLGVRTVVVRTGVVLDRHEGALAALVPPFRMFVGGPILPGTQWFSWVHVADAVGLLLFALEDERVQGPLNATAPDSQTSRGFARLLGKVLGRPAVLPMPGFGLKVLLGEFADTLTTGQRVVPQKALALGYAFQYPMCEEALRQVLG